MAETVAQKRQRKLQANIVAARARRESSREDAAVERVVTDSRSEQTTPAATQPTNNDNDLRTRHYTAKHPSDAVIAAREGAKANAREQATTKSDSNWGSTWARSLTPKPQAKLYQKHVLFALVSAFIINLIANGKSLPVKGS